MPGVTGYQAQMYQHIANVSKDVHRASMVYEWQTLKLQSEPTAAQQEKLEHLTRLLWPPRKRRVGMSLPFVLACEVGAILVIGFWFIWESWRRRQRLMVSLPPAPSPSPPVHDDLGLDEMTWEWPHGPTTRSDS